MIGVVVVAHGNIGCEMVAAVHQIIPEAKHIIGVAVESDDPPESIRKMIAEAVEKIDDGDGVMILSDMFGGTPSNICLSFLEPPRIEVLSGFNLPMLVKLANIKPDADFQKTVEFIQQYGQRNIVIASQMLGKQKCD